MKSEKSDVLTMQYLKTFHWNTLSKQTYKFSGEMSLRNALPLAFKSSSPLAMFISCCTITKEIGKTKNEGND